MIIPTHTGGTYERFGCFRIYCPPGNSGDNSDVLSLEDYLALPGMEDKEAYEKIIPGHGNNELRYIISLI